MRQAAHVAGEAALTVALCILTACGGDAAQGVPPAAPVPACKTVTRFGNSATCVFPPAPGEAQAAPLPECGAAATRLCSRKGLCFDSPDAFDCACTADADCQQRADYINVARLKQKKAPLIAKCDGWRCSGDL